MPALAPPPTHTHTTHSPTNVTFSHFLERILADALNEHCRERTITYLRFAGDTDALAKKELCSLLRLSCRKMGAQSGIGLNSTPKRLNSTPKLLSSHHK